MASPPAVRTPHPVRGMVLLALCLLLVAPPIHWLAGQGDRLISIGYFIGTAVLVVLALALIARQERTQEEEN